LVPVFSVLAATGTIDSTYKYAWSTQLGWINFGCSGCNVQITDSAITGYAWSTNYGWINLNPTQSGVKNDGHGVLSGKAWGQNTGWIDFGSVTINSSGQFVGTASGDIVGTVNFSCTETGCPVTTTWRNAFCGDGICNNGETCNTCIDDCGTCGGPGGGDSYNECNSKNQCVSVLGYGANKCFANSDCTPHNECNSQNQCVAINGVGMNQCRTNTDCIVTHSECNSQSQCVSVSGSGINQCQANNDCFLGKHNECNSQNQCVAVDGIGSNQCLSDTDCHVTHSECNLQRQCIDVDGVGINQCKTSSDCQPAKHNECNSQNQCVVVNGAGADFCQTNSDCRTTHSECNGLKCLPVLGVGINQCTKDSDCVISKHNLCNSSRQCAAVNGEGPDQCQTDSDCNLVTGNVCGNAVCDSSEDCNSCSSDCGQCTIITPVIETIGPLVDDIKKIIETPQGSAVTKIISTVGVATGIIAIAVTAAFAPASIFELFLLPLRLFGLLLTAFGLRKKVKSWGVVYDSVTKRPIDPAYVVLKNLQTGKILSAITDLDGRYGFLVEPGTYQMSARKSNYIFPSQKLAGKTNDELYADLYFGENIYIKSSEEVIAKNIPLDPVKFDWNEFEKKNKNLMKFYSKWDIILRKIYDFFFVVGFFVALVAFVFAPYPYNTIIMVLYLFLLLLRFLGLKPKSYGSVMDKATGEPLSFAIIRIVLPDSNKEISSKSADKYGKYYCLVPSGKYYVKIDKKNNDGSYSLIFTSGIIDASKNGIIKETFKV